MLKHYFKPGRETFRAALEYALPKGLIGETAPPAKSKRQSPADELAARAAAADRRRRRVLAAKV